MPANYGQSARVSFAPAATIAAWPAANTFRPIRFFSNTVQVKADWQPNPVIGGTVENAFDTPDLQQDMPSVGGANELPLCINQMGDILAWIFGAPVTTGASSPFTHTFRSGRAPGFRASEVWLAANRQRRQTGLVPTGFMMDFARENGIQRYNVEIIGRNDTTETTALSGLGTERAYSPLQRRLATLTLNGSAAADATALKIDYKTGVTEVAYLDGTGLVGNIEQEADCTLTGTLSVRTNSDTFHALGDSGNVVTLGATMGTGAAAFQLTANTRLGRFGQPIPGRGGLITEIPFTGVVAASTPMLAIALSNALPANTFLP